MSAVITQRLVDLARALQREGKGRRTALCQAAAQELGLSLATIYRKLEEVSVATTTRKRRSDAGSSDLTREEALTISAALMESARHNEKRLYSLGDAVDALRASGMIRAEAVDKGTGELRPMSLSAIGRALRSYKLHPDQLLAPAPVTELASLHPNHVWQIDASLCVLYYLKHGTDPRANGLQVMDHDQFYKNKPKNLARIAADRVWSYEITSHSAGWIYLEYVMGAESGENLCSVLINAMQERGGADVMHGRPEILMMDPGSANTSAMARNLCRSLGIQMIVHAPGAARVTGQVENARNIIERKFEAGLRFQPVADLAELNALAKRWREWFNATAIHSRHGKSRTAAWLTIRQEQLVKVPSVEICRQLAVAEPESRKVNTKLRVSFQGNEYDVSMVPNVMVGDRLMLTRNPWASDAAQVVATDAAGHEVFYVVPEVKRNEMGFEINAPVIGQAFKRQADTPAQTARKEAAKLAMGAETQEEVDAARKAKQIPFGGQLQPYKQMDEAELPTFMPRRGTQHDLVVPTIELPPMSHVAAAKALRGKVKNWSADSLAWLKTNYPDGVPEAELDTIAATLNKPARPGLRVVGGE
ncbi:DDE-type integrase/transposase/recombinase [Aquipseudomonas alcaligenes]|uniref:Integrase core domain-containing protein n=1 Tax=Aquipseudomonas alcaligenes TaxID=43263 RepID=A0A1N6NBS3_AQUAC|nr:DDE-type integrase/transposase/recombinase [Pseudomonas alcaligenes]SIP89528.1 Integrase core domain-containing protein [Pseudomonas alcaligenes]